jgi:hypothetical protein
MAKEAFVEYRPKSHDKNAPVSRHVVIVDGNEEHTAKTQKEAAEWATRLEFIVHVARERHLQDQSQPAHWRKYP